MATTESPCGCHSVELHSGGMTESLRGNRQIVDEDAVGAEREVQIAVRFEIRGEGKSRAVG